MTQLLLLFFFSKEVSAPGEGMERGPQSPPQAPRPERFLGAYTDVRRRERNATFDYNNVTL